MPPSTTKYAPITDDGTSDVKYAVIAAISPGSPQVVGLQASTCPIGVLVAGGDGVTQGVPAITGAMQVTHPLGDVGHCAHHGDK